MEYVDDPMLPASFWNNLAKKKPANSSDPELAARLVGILENGSPESSNAKLQYSQAVQAGLDAPTEVAAEQGMPWAPVSRQEEGRGVASVNASPWASMLKSPDSPWAGNAAPASRGVAPAQPKMIAAKMQPMNSSASTSISSSVEPQDEFQTEMQAYRQAMADQEKRADDMGKNFKQEANLAPGMFLADFLSGDRSMNLRGSYKKPETKEERMAKVEALKKAAMKDREGYIGLLGSVQDRRYRREDRKSDEAFRNAQLALERDRNALLAKKDQGGKELSQHTIDLLAEGNNIPGMLDQLLPTVTNNKDVFGPVSGRKASWNPWNTKGQTIDAQFRTASQLVGKYMEGGVLRKEDEAKYRAMLPTLSDPPDIAANKLALVKRMLVEKQNERLNAYYAQGFNMRGLEPKFTAPGRPAALDSKRKMTSSVADAEVDVNNMSREQLINFLSGAR